MTTQLSAGERAQRIIDAYGGTEAVAQDKIVSFVVILLLAEATGTSIKEAITLLKEGTVMFEAESIAGKVWAEWSEDCIEEGE